EVGWMAEQLVHTVEQTFLYNYSVYEQRELSGRDVTNFQRMAADPALREVTLVVSRKPRPGAHPVHVDDWKTTLVDLEPAGTTPAWSGEELTTTEPLLVELRAE